MRTGNSAPISSAKANAQSLPAGGGNAHAAAEKILKISLESARLGSAVVLHCHDRAISRDDARALAGLICEVLPSARRMILDLNEVHSLDSGALGELVMIHMWAEAAGYSLPFASPSDSVRGLFEATNLVSVFDVYSSVESAIAALNQEQIRSA
jgi:anti-anti-sigma factor